MIDRIIDTSVLSPFARARKLDVLERLTAGSRRLITRSVQNEIDNGAKNYPELKGVRPLVWLELVRVDSLPELTALAMYTRLLVDDEFRNVGESSVLAYAEVHRSVALMDDAVAVQVGRQRDVKVQRTLSLIACSIRSGLLREDEAVALVSDLITAGARYPQNTVEEFSNWRRWLPESAK